MVREADVAPPVVRGTAAWRYFGDFRDALLAGQVLVLQVAHPVVAAGVRDHSDYREDPWTRLMRTVASLSIYVYGGTKGAQFEAERLRKLHRSFTGIADGRRYSALDPGAYAWVHATLVMAPVDAQRFFGRPMSTSELDEYYAQMCGIGRILGVRERDLPPTWPEFERYCRETIAGFGPNETISTLFETIDTVRKPFSRMSDRRWPKLQKGYSTVRLFLIRTPDVPLRPGPASAAPALLRGTALVQSIRPHRQPRPLRPGCPQRPRLGESLAPTAPCEWSES